MRRLRADDSEAWRRAMRDVAPLRGRVLDPDRVRLARPHPNPPALAGEGVEARGEPAVRSVTPARSEALSPLDRLAGVDRATAERLKRGRYPIAARLDLHGMTQAEAHRALAGFVPGSRAAGRRCLLVITGHGRMSGGILKAAVPRWLDEPELRRHVLAIAPARPDAGGSGALYVLLRRRESPAGD
jgi:DNA-nicking Smr family endonuclease